MIDHAELSTYFLTPYFVHKLCLKFIFITTSPFKSSRFEAGLHWQVAKPRMLLEITFRAKLVLQNLRQISHIFTRRRLEYNTNHINACSSLVKVFSAISIHEYCLLNCAYHPPLNTSFS